MTGEFGGTPLYRRARRVAGKLLRRIPGIRGYFSASTRYEILTRDQAIAAQQSSPGWLAGLTAARQQAAYAHLLDQMRSGSVRIDLQVAADAIAATGLANPSLVEVGSGSGYYSEVLGHLLGNAVDYTGVDYSPAMIDAARKAYPELRFEVGDGCDLPFADAAFDIAFNGASLMHILDYERAIQEGARVARRFCIYHSVPVFRDRATTYLRKLAYGAPVVEIVFSRDELLAIFALNGMEMVQSWQSIDYDVHPATPEHSTCETFLLRVAIQPAA